MRRLTGLIDSVEYVITEHERGMVEVPAVLYPQFLDHDGKVVAGRELEDRCRTLFGDTLEIRDYAAGATPPEEDA